MHYEIKSPCNLKVRHYSDRKIDPTIDLNEYLSVLPRENASDIISVMEFKKLNSRPNSWSKHAYVQGFDCENITFKNM